MLHFELLGTSGCHLCDLAETVLYRHTDSLHFRFRTLDIVDDDRLLAEYALRIPVLRYENACELPWPFDDETLVEFIARVRASQPAG